MLAPPHSADEAMRLAALHSLSILDTAPEERFDRITRTAARLFDVPIALISLVDANRQWFKSCLGLPDTEMPRGMSFCAHAILGDEPLVISDTHADPRFAANPLVTGEPFIRFYAGHPLSGPDGSKLGTLCIIDRRPRALNNADIQSLRDLTVWAENEVGSFELGETLLIQRESEARVRTILESIADAVVTFDAQGVIKSLNPSGERLFGYTEDEAIAKPLDLFIANASTDAGNSETDIPVSDNTTQQLISMLKPRLEDDECISRTQAASLDRHEFVGRRRDGSIFNLEIGVSAMRMGERPLFIGSMHDVTMRKRAERALYQSELVSMVSHELRTPLTSIKGYVDLLLDGEVGELADEQRDFLKIVKNNADRLIRLINDLLDTSRVEAGKIELKFAPVDLAHAIHSVQHSLRPQLEAKRQDLMLNLAEELPPVFADSERVSQILTNLLSNAHKYTPENGRITVTAVVVDGMVRVDVQDTGIGLSPEEQQHIFDKFFRAKNRATRDVGGTGLGLSITEALVHMHGGEISVESKQGQGSTLSFTLPVATGVVKNEAYRPLIVPTERILVVDDDRDITHLIRRYLERAGYQVLIAHTAQEGVKLAQSEQPDLITLDIMLPDVDGFTALEWLKHDAATAHIPIILVSILPDIGRGRLVGAVGYLTKPVHEQALLKHIGQILADTRANILLVDDDESIREMLSEMLARAGYGIRTAADGADALEAIRQAPPDLALIDVKMPGIDGLTVLRELRADVATRNLSVIMMTATPGALEHNREIIEELGSTVLAKPLTPEELAAAITRGLRERRAK